MNKNSTIHIRVNPEIKADAERIYEAFGITMTEAINIFLHQSILNGGLPFEMKYPGYNKETLKALKEAKDIASGKIKQDPTTVDKFFEEMNIKC
ncbi:MAG: type II toxin-antitoxin system RelB/DinJ family antitoxin [Clostridiales bacterium]|nr:type II toxin-antitoxin system RelB/DinJ family antitoxin [Clostridiales bacterium]